MKPQIVVDVVCDYLSNYSGNAHRGDYDLSHEVDEQYENARQIIQEFIHAKKKEEIVFTSGTTDSLNMIAFGYARYHLKKDDEILLTVAEHASNILPWFEVAKETGAKVKYIELDEKGRVTLENVKKAISDKTKIISIAWVTNVLGYEAPIQEITHYAHQKRYYCCGGWSTKCSTYFYRCRRKWILISSLFQDIRCAVQQELVSYMENMNYYNKLTQCDWVVNESRFNSCGVVTLKNPPYKFEAGTPHIERGYLVLDSAV